MKYVVDHRLVLARSPEGPLARHIVSFAKSISEQGYGLVSLRNQVLVAVGFSHWLKRQGVGLRSICGDSPARYLRYRARHQRPKKGDRAALRHLMDFLRHDGLIPKEKTRVHRLTPVEQHVEAYVQHLRAVRALAEPTIAS